MIKHDGIVIAIKDDGVVRVRIVQTSACASCKAKQMCASAESSEKEMDVQMLTDMASIQLGDTVEVMVQQKMGWKAVLLAYVLPFVVMMAVVVLLNGVVKEEVSGTIALCTMGVYYIVLGLFKNRIQKEFSFMGRKRE